MLLVDAFNVVRAQWVLPPARRGMDVRGLIRMIGGSRFAGRRLRVVVDGNPAPDWVRHGILETQSGIAWTRVGKAEVVFSGRVREADDVIEEILSREHAFEITVVSSDRRLVRAAGRAGADHIGNGSFLKLLDEDLARAGTDAIPAFAAEVPLDPYSIAHWMRAFGFEPTRREPSAPASGGSALGEPNKPTRPTESNKPAASNKLDMPDMPDMPDKPDKPDMPASNAFGTRLSVSLPREPSPAELPPKGIKPSAVSVAAGASEPLDPLLREAFAEWAGHFSPEDLDMRRWIKGVDPI